MLAITITPHRPDKEWVYIRVGELEFRVTAWAHESGDGRLLIGVDAPKESVEVGRFVPVGTHKKQHGP